MVVVESQLATPSQSLAPVSIADCESVPRVWVADIGLEVHPAVFGQYADPECSQAPVDCEAIQKAATAEDVLLAFGLISQRFRRHYGIELRIPGCNAGQEQCFLNIYTSITDEDASPPWNAGTSLGLEGLRVAFRQSTDYAPRALTHFLLSSTTNGASNPDAVCGEAVAFSQSHFLGTSPPTGFRVARHEIEHLFGGVHSSGLPAFCGEVDGSSEISSDLLCQQHIVRVITEAAPCLQELVFALGDWNRDSLLDSFDLAAAEACVRAPSLPCTDTFDFDGDRRVTPCDVDTLQRHEDYAGAVPAEPDCNTNAINDCTEIAQSPFADCDGNGVPDTCDLAAGGSDCNSNAVLDACESGDCSWDGADFDICGVEAGATDCDNNNIPDICDVNAGHDCNHNQVPDECDIFLQTSSDCNENLIPDECIARERDCNLNGVPDECDTEALTSVDCNANQVPDECEPGYDMDCNANDVMDVCEVASGVAADINDDGVPDECDVSQILYVTSTSQCPGSGTPQEPFCDIKRALEAADEDGVAYEIVLADGVYTGSGNRFLSFRSDRVIVRSQNGPEACIVDYRTSEVTLQQTGFVFSGDGPGIQVSGITFTNSFTPSDFASAAPMVVSDDSSPRIEGCVFRDLRVVRKGGVISVGPGTHPVIENCRFENIQSDYFGAIGLLGGGNAEIVNCEFINVHTDLHGAAIFVEDASGRIVNSLFVGNTAGGWGGAVFSTYGNVSLINCTLANNEAAGRGGAVMGSLESVVSIRNTIIWDNVASQGPGLWVDGSSQLGANFSNVQGGLLSAGCPASAEWNAINSEPVFIDPEAGDYRVACSSPCRDSADATARPPDSGDLDSDGDTSEPIPVDLAGVGRVLGGGIDIGSVARVAGGR
jgi:hypothetical protein